MSALATGGVVFVCVLGGALVGMLLRRALPEHHFSVDSRDSIKLGMGLMVTMAALVLSLLIASAKSSYDTRSGELTQMAASIVLLDRALAHYGPETKDARETLRTGIARIIEQTWPAPGAPPAELNPRSSATEHLYDKLLALTPKTDDQRLLRNEALRIATDLGRTRWLLFVQGGGSIPLPFLAMLVVWVAIVFASFGLFAPPNATVLVTLLICALSVSGAIFMILELDQPFRGIIRIPSDQLRTAIANLGR